MRLLAVDDEPIVLELIKANLPLSKGFAISTADSAGAAIKIITEQQTPFDAFLLDIKMPGTSGVSVVI